MNIFRRENDIEKNVEFAVAALVLNTKRNTPYPSDIFGLLNSNSLSLWTICVRSPSKELNGETQTTEMMFKRAPHWLSHVTIRYARELTLEPSIPSWKSVFAYMWLVACATRVYLKWILWYIISSLVNGAVFVDDLSHFNRWRMWGKM